MALFGRDKLAKYTDEVGAYLKVIDHIKELQAAQREMADSIQRVGDRVQALEIEFRALKAEIRTETLRETQSIVNAVQGQFYKNLQDIAVDVAVLRQQTRSGNDSALKLRAPSSDGAEPPRMDP
jgi:hypothetical protein